MLKVGYYKTIYDEDVDILDEHGKYILRFRKNILSQKNVENAYDAIIKFANVKTSARGSASGTPKGKREVATNNKIASNIAGYFDTLSMSQKAYFRDAGLWTKRPNCRQTAFTMNNPEKWEQIIPLIKNIDSCYKQLFPKEHRVQLTAAKSTKFRIDSTAFSTITINLNFQTACHYDSGDFDKGYGNLIVIEKGKYKHGYIGFPQYGIGINVRTGDFLGMNVHLLHGNEPIVPVTKDAQRLSFVSYLRQGIVDKCTREPMRGYDYFEYVRNLARKRKKTVKRR